MRFWNVDFLRICGLFKVLRSPGRAQSTLNRPWFHKRPVPYLLEPYRFTTKPFSGRLRCKCVLLQTKPVTCLFDVFLANSFMFVLLKLGWLTGATRRKRAYRGNLFLQESIGLMLIYIVLIRWYIKILLTDVFSLAFLCFLTDPRILGLVKINAGKSSLSSFNLRWMLK